MTRDEIMQNKIYRAVHDGVCPSCGSDCLPAGSLGTRMCSKRCGFFITATEMEEFRVGVQAWGVEVAAFMHRYRNGHN